MLLTACISKANNPNVEVVSPQEFQTRLSQDPDGYLLDVRKPDEFASGHLRGAHPLNWLDKEEFRRQAAALDKSKTIYLYCRSGRRSSEAANYLAEQGFKVVDMDGGILAWEKASLPSTTDSDPGVSECCRGNVSRIVVDNMMTRRSIRKYADKEVPRQLLDTILNCGINAPNGRNQQAYEIKVVADPASAAYLSDKVKGLYKAPVYIFIANRADYDMSQIDVGLLSGNIGLAAWAYGIGSVNLGGPVRAINENATLLGELGFSEGYHLCLVLALGYPDETPAAKPRDKNKIQYVEITE